MPAITRRRASPVDRSRITRRGGRHAALPARWSLIRQSLRACPAARGASRRRGWRRAGRRGRSGRPLPALQEAEEISFGRQYEGGIAAVERLAIGRKRAVKSEDLLILTKGVGIDLPRLRVAVAAYPLRISLRLGKNHGAFAFGVGAHGLGRLGALAAILPRLLLALGLHAGVDRLAVLLGQIGAPQPHIDDFDAETLGLGRNVVANLPHDRGALLAHDIRHRAI